MDEDRKWKLRERFAARAHARTERFLNQHLKGCEHVEGLGPNPNAIDPMSIESGKLPLEVYAGRLAGYLRRLRAGRGWNHYEIMELVSPFLHGRTYQHYERGSIRIPNVEVAVQLAYLFGCDPLPLLHLRLADMTWRWLEGAAVCGDYVPLDTLRETAMRLWPYHLRSLRERHPTVP